MLHNGIEDIIYKNKIYYSPQEEINAKRLGFIQDAFKYHYEMNSYYREMCVEKNVVPGDINGYEDLVKIPMIAIDNFKKKEIREKLITPSDLPADRFLTKIESSGTSGVSSIGFRNPTSGMRSTLSLISNTREFLENIFGGFGMLFIVPNQYIPNLGIMKIMGVLQLALDGYQYLIDDPKVGPDIERCIKLLKSNKGVMTRHLIGAPYLILDLVQYLKEKGEKLPLDPDSIVLSIGGWKRKVGDICERGLYNEMVSETFDVPNERIRDYYAMAESNLFITECQYQKKHIPPWGYFSIRSFEEPRKVAVPVGEEGLVSYYDTINTTYPGFVISGDVGVISSDGVCECGRYGQILEFKRRATGAEIRSCALHMDHFVQTQTAGVN
jgi:long-chain-fatty-acid---luciferin-component ligase